MCTWQHLYLKWFAKMLPRFSEDTRRNSADMHVTLYANWTECVIMVDWVWHPTERKHADTTPQLSRHPPFKHPFPCARKICLQTFVRGLRASGDEKKFQMKNAILKMPHIPLRCNRPSSRSVLLLAAVSLVASTNPARNMKFMVFVMIRLLT
jgi:hypothetical protein